MQDIYKVETHPLALSENMITGDKYRITFLTEGLIRLEYDEEGVFEDRPTQMVFFRDFPKADYRVVRTEDGIEVHTKRIHLIYNEKEFTSWGLSIQVKGNLSAYHSIWHYGEEIHDLKGTARTLDMVDGATELEHGILSRFGYSLVDDSRSQVLLPDSWIEPRRKGIKDLYFFGYGHDYKEALHDFYRLCGKTPMLPRFALGNWWSRYYKYSEESYNELMDKFQEKNIPFTVAVIDMDWHVTDVDPKYGSGWTGYTWNKELFPDPKRFLEGLHKRGMRTTLNVHPADGVQGWEEMYEDMAKAMGVDYENEDPVVCDPASPKFIEAYFKYLHHPREEEGVDFWWIDWQQGNTTKLPGLDPLWMLNHYHYLDSSWKGNRPLTFSRYAGVGSHRYPVGFSGDSVISWESLQFQPYFTNTASNVGYGWWSHDIGGHMMGIRDDELMARWVEYGVFSPINRLHSTDNPFNGKEPWKFDKITQGVMEDYLRLRHGMVPYLYTMNHRANYDDLPLIQPMYYLEPDREEAYQVPNEYYFGSELLVSPITEKQDPEVRAAKVTTWLPEGMWVDFFTGMVYQGGRMIDLWRGVEDMPVLMKAGAIVPMKDMADYDSSTDNPKAMEVRVFPAEDGTFTLWEDQGDTPVDKEENWVATQLTFTGGEEDTFTIGKALGNVSVIPESRSWKVVFMGVEKACCKVTADGEEVAVKVSYDKAIAALTVEVPETAVGKEIVITFADGISLAENDLAGRCYAMLDKAQIPYNLKSDIQAIVEKMGKDGVATLATMNLSPALFGAVLEILNA